jgi:hypothetical protein
MASSQSIEQIPLATIHEDLEKDNAPLLATGRGLVSIQYRLHRFLRIAFITTIVLGVTSCVTVIAREFLEYVGYDDKDRGLLSFPETVYTRRDWPIMIMVSLSSG